MRKSILFLTAFCLMNVLNAQTLEQLEGSTGTSEKAPKEKAVKEEKVKEEKVKEEKVKEEKIKEEEAPKVKEPKPDKKAQKAEEAAILAEVKKESTDQPKAASQAAGISGMPLRSWSIGLDFDLVEPMTDIRYKSLFGTFKPMNENKFGGTFSLTKMLSGAFGLQAQFKMGSSSGVVDSGMTFKNNKSYLGDAGLNLKRGAYFKTPYKQVNLNLYWDISNTVYGMNRMYRGQKNDKPYKQRCMGFYAFAGIGLNFFDPQLNYLDADTAFTATDMQNKGFYFSDEKATEVVVPVGIGMKFKLGNAVDLNLAASSQLLLSDKFDAVIFDYPNRRKNDAIGNVSAGLVFKLGTKKNDKAHISWVNNVESLYGEVAKMDRKLDKLSKDSDQDGVSDMFDKENDTPAETRVDGSGLAMDVDYDGVPDKNDLQMFSVDPRNVDEFGVSKDDDGDGVPNINDLEAGTPKGNFVNFQGVTIVDKLALHLPDGSATAAPSMPSVYFDYNKYNIKREFEDELYQIAVFAKTNPNAVIHVIGNTDIKGSDKYNMDLGKKRAETVVQYLMDTYKLKKESFIAESRGKNELSTSKDYLNRRVDFVLKN